MKWFVLPACVVWLLVLPSASAPLASTQGSCPDLCLPALVEDIVQDVGDPSAMITIVQGAATAGQATAGCGATCAVCDMQVTVSWTCQGACGQGTCTYIWENQSYDRNGNAKPKQTGTGQGEGSFTTTLTSPCSSGSLPNPLQGSVGISVAGSKRVWHLVCGC